MKYIKSFFLSAAAALFPAVSFAVPAKPGIVSAEQPDGSTIDVRITGDERGHTIFSADGYLLIANSDGYFYATQDAEGKTVNSGVRAVNADRRSPETVKFLSGLDRESMRRAAISRLDFRFRLPASLSELPGGYPYLASLLFTLALGVGLGLTNFIKIYAYNARARACNGLLSVVSLFTAVFAVADFMNSTFYILLLDCCVAFQMGHYFRLYAQRRAYVLAIGLMVVYGGFYIWSL